MEFAFFDAIITAYLNGKLTADQANAWFRLTGMRFVVGS